MSDSAPVPPASGLSDERLARAISDLRWYADRLCVDKPERYEIIQTSAGTETKLSESVRVVLAAVLSRVPEERTRT